MVSCASYPLAKGLATPWSLAFLPNGDMLVTEKAGKLRIVRGGTLDPQPVTGTPEVFAVGQGGLLEVALHPQFAQNQFVYLTYSKGKDKEGTTALARGRFDGKALVDVKDLLVTDNWNQGGVHFGSKLAFGKDGMLYMSVGERNDRVRAQNTNIHGGKICGSKTTAPCLPIIRSWARLDTSPRSSRGGTATFRGSPSIPTPAPSGPPNTARRAATSST